MRLRLLFAGLALTASTLLAGCETTHCCSAPPPPRPAAYPPPCCGNAPVAQPIPATSGFAPARAPIIATVPGPTAP
jgi:hypothetical protein